MSTLTVPVRVGLFNRCQVTSLPIRHVVIRLFTWSSDRPVLCRQTVPSCAVRPFRPGASDCSTAPRASLLISETKLKLSLFVLKCLKSISEKKLKKNTWTYIREGYLANSFQLKVTRVFRLVEWVSVLDVEPHANTPPTPISCQRWQVSCSHRNSKHARRNS